MARPAKLLTVRIVPIDDARGRRRRARAFEQAALRREIILEGLVIIEMVARKIRENCHRKRASPQTVHRERMRTGFENGVRASGADHVRQKALQVERFRSGVGRGARLAHQPMANRAEQADFATRGAENRVHQVGRRRLAVCPGHANELQNLGGMPKIICRGDCQCLARVRDLDPGKFRGNCPGHWLLAGDGDRSARDGVGTNLLPSVFSPRMATNSVPGFTWRLS